MNKNYENNNRRTNSVSKVNSNEEPEQPRSFLSELFKVPADAVDAEAERDQRLGHTPRNTNKSGSSFSK